MTQPLDAVTAIHNAFRRDMSIIDSAAIDSARGKPGLTETIERYRFLNEVLVWHAQGEELAIFPALEGVAPLVAWSYERDHHGLDAAFDALNDAVSYVVTLTSQAAKLFYEGKSKDVIQQDDLIQTLFDHIDRTAITTSCQRKLIENYGYYSLLRERSVAGTLPASRARQSMAQTIVFLNQSAKTYHLPNLSAYAAILAADIYYMIGAMNRKSTLNAFAKAAQQAERAFVLLPNDHPEKFAALRLLTASSCYQHDSNGVRYAETAAKPLFRSQIIINPVNAVHLSKVLTKGKVMVGDRNPFSFEEQMYTLLESVPQQEGIYYQLSDLKTRIETFALFKIKDRQIILPLIERGLTLVQQGIYPRHKQFFTHQLQQFS